MKTFLVRLLGSFGLLSVLALGAGTAYASPYPYNSTNLSLTQSVDGSGMIQLKWNPIAAGSKISGSGDTGIVDGYAVFLRKSSDTDAAWNKKPFALLKISGNEYTYYNLSNMPSATYVAQVAAYGVDVTGYHFNYYTNQVFVQVGSTINDSSSLIWNTYPQDFVPANIAGTTTSLSLTGTVSECMLKYNWTTLPSSAVQPEGYAVFLKNANETDPNWSIKPFALLRKSLNNYNYYNLSGMPYGTYIAKVAAYNYDVIGYKFDTYSNEVTITNTCGVPPVIVSLTAPMIVQPMAGQVFTTMPRVTTIQWSPVKDAASYQIAIECDICGSAMWESKYPIYSTSATSLTTPALAGDNTFRVRVRAISAGTEGPWSDYRLFSFVTPASTNTVPVVVPVTPPVTQRPSTVPYTMPPLTGVNLNQDLYLNASYGREGVTLGFGFQNDAAQEESSYQQFMVERYLVSKRNMRVMSSKKLFYVDPDEDTFLDTSAIYGKKYAYRVYAITYLANGQNKILGSSPTVKLLVK